VLASEEADNTPPFGAALAAEVLVSSNYFDTLYRSEPDHGIVFTFTFTLTVFRRAGDEWYGRSGAAQAANHQVCNGINATRLRLRLRLTAKEHHFEVPFASS
jgi:hypothetical protein